MHSRNAVSICLLPQLRLLPQPQLQQAALGAGSGLYPVFAVDCTPFLDAYSHAFEATVRAGNTKSRSSSTQTCAHSFIQVPFQRLCRVLRS